jgi:hypothetical protein
MQDGNHRCALHRGGGAPALRSSISRHLLSNFLLALFVVGRGLALLQVAINPPLGCLSHKMTHPSFISASVEYRDDRNELIIRRVYLSMNRFGIPQRRRLIVRAAALLAISSLAHAQNPGPVQAQGAGLAPARPRSSVGSQGSLPVHQTYDAEVVASGATLFVQNCGFCHGKDAGGGEAGQTLHGRSW